MKTPCDFVLFLGFAPSLFDLGTIDNNEFYKHPTFQKISTRIVSTSWSSWETTVPTSTAWLGPASTRLLIVLEFFKNKNTGKRKFINYSVQWKDLLFQLLHPQHYQTGATFHFEELVKHSVKVRLYPETAITSNFLLNFFLALLYCF